MILCSGYLRLFGHGGVAGLCRLGVLFGRRIGFICVARMNGLIIICVMQGNKDETSSTPQLYAEVCICSDSVHTRGQNSRSRFVVHFMTVNVEG